MSMPLSIKPSMRLRMISARLTTLPVLLRISVARRLRWWICRSKSTTDTLDQVSLWTGGRPGPTLLCGRVDDRTGTGLARVFAMREPDGAELYSELLVAHTQQ